MDEDLPAGGPAEEAPNPRFGTFVLCVRLGGERLIGSITAGTGRVTEFHGWIEFMSVINRLRREGSRRDDE